MCGFAPILPGQDRRKGRSYRECSHTNLPKEYAATSDAHRNDAAQPHARRRIPTFALSVATSTLTKAHNSAPKNSAAHGSSTGVGGGMGPVLPMFLTASARQIIDVAARTHQKLTESFSRSSLPLLTHTTLPDPRARPRVVAPIYLVLGGRRANTTKKQTLVRYAHGGRTGAG